VLYFFASATADAEILAMRVRTIPLSLAAVVLVAIALSLPARCAATATAQASPAPVSFAPLEQWRQAVFSGDAAKIASLYSTSPPAQIHAGGQTTVTAADDAAFWQSWKAKGLTSITLELVGQQSPTLDEREFYFQVALHFAPHATPANLFIGTAQYWVRREGEWHIATAARMNPARLRQPLTTDKVIYPPDLDAHAEIADALQRAAATNRRVILVFGGNWCFDCHVLDQAFHSPEIGPTLDRGFIVVHVDVGHFDKNLDVAEKYAVPITKGVPALAVLDSTGKLLVSQQGGEFQDARSMAPEDILAFLNKWRPPAPKP
jgi:hypothetical protein